MKRPLFNSCHGILQSERNPSTCRFFQINVNISTISVKFPQCLLVLAQIKDMSGPHLELPHCKGCILEFDMVGIHIIILDLTNLYLSIFL